jgi:hypothetical protein
MSKPAPVTNKVHQNLAASTRRMAASLEMDADELARERFGAALDELPHEQWHQIELIVVAAFNEKWCGKPTDQPHDATCIGCGSTYRCFCRRDHRQGECHYCHNNTTHFQEYRRVMRGGDPLD